MQINKPDNPTDTHRQILTHNLYIVVIQVWFLEKRWKLFLICLKFRSEFSKSSDSICNFIHYGAFQLLRSDDSRILKKFQLEFRRKNWIQQKFHEYLSIFKSHMIQVVRFNFDSTIHAGKLILMWQKESFSNSFYKS